MKVVAIIQARMGSTRLPGKVLRELAGKTMLYRVVNRTRRVKLLDQVVVAAPEAEANNVLADACKEMGVACFRGDEDDVLDRYYRAALAFGAEVVVRITSDCPLIEPEIIERVVGGLLDHYEELDYVCSFIPRRTFPIGLDVEAMKFAVLEQAWREDNNPAWREHVTEYVLHHPELFRMQGVTNDTDLSRMRWTVDTIEDFQFVQKIYDHFGGDDFTWQQVLRLLDQHPEWLAINRHIQQKVVA